MRTLVIVTVIGLCLALASVLFWPDPGPEEGRWYVLEGRDSLAVQLLVDSDTAASPATRKVVHDLLAGDMRVRIDRIGRCAHLTAHYEGVNAQLNLAEDPLARILLQSRPIALFDSTARACFAYQVTFPIPLNPPVVWRDRQLREVPVHFFLIHPEKDFRQFRHANSH
ncbi:MAG: hypothetical protein OXM02_04830 [Bacteroidota bacterium]|nr:hypothetical protein [Bacteroidota bacterium]MDE2833827.1 hypothetical protein [Bacteroidota bacterium]MDE2957397.1 hypothetical protein [Bacteroidota bacterium]